jgi:transposase-like protein
VTKQRKRFAAEQKAAIVRQHLVDRKSIADVCEEHAIQPTVFYRWQKQVFDGLPALFEKSSACRPTRLEGEIAQLKSKLARKDEVIAEITQDYIDAKKKIGDR